LQHSTSSQPPEIFVSLDCTRILESQTQTDNVRRLLLDGERFMEPAAQGNTFLETLNISCLKDLDVSLPDFYELLSILPKRSGASDELIDAGISVATHGRSGDKLAARLQTRKAITHKIISGENLQPSAKKSRSSSVVIDNATLDV